jgi:hypothetical protein
MDSKPIAKFAKAHSRLVADEYLRLGWTLDREFYADGDEEPYEYLFVWESREAPRHIDWKAFPSGKTN